MSLDVYVFTSDSLENVQLGAAAGQWAVSVHQLESVAGLRTKAEQMPIGSLGLLYCVETKAFMVPFVTLSTPSSKHRETKVWRGEWALPFRIKPLGSADRRVHKDRLAALIPSLERGATPWTALFHIQATLAFVPSKLSKQDWSALIEVLATPTP